MDFASFMQLLGAQLVDRCCDVKDEEGFGVLWWIFLLRTGEQVAVLRRSYREGHRLLRFVDDALIERLRQDAWSVWNTSDSGAMNF